MKLPLIQITALSHDPVQGVTMSFHTKEAAILFAERQGYEYWLEEPKPEKFRVKAYADNFKVKVRVVKNSVQYH